MSLLPPVQVFTTIAREAADLEGPKSSATNVEYLYEELAQVPKKIFLLIGKGRLLSQELALDGHDTLVETQLMQ